MHIFHISSTLFYITSHFHIYVLMYISTSSALFTLIHIENTRITTLRLTKVHKICIWKIAAPCFVSDSGFLLHIIHSGKVRPLSWHTDWTDLSRSEFCPATWNKSRWRHQMETFFALLTLCEGNPPDTGGFPPPRPVTQGLDVFFDLRLNKWFSKQ